MIEPFAVDVPQAVLDDLAHRLAATRRTEDFANEDWRYGVNAACAGRVSVPFRCPVTGRSASPAEASASSYC